MNEAEQIQLAFPSEPIWAGVSDATLIQLVHEHLYEPSCAQSAITELKVRRHPKTEALCRDLLFSEAADKWLRTGALGILLTLNPLEGLTVALAFIDDCEFELLEEIIEALNYEHQGELSSAVHSHCIIPHVKVRLAQPGSDQVKFRTLFIEHFGS